MKMKVKDLIEELKAVNPDAEVWFAENANLPIKGGYIMYADERGSEDEENAGELKFHDSNWSMTGELAILIHEED